MHNLKFAILTIFKCTAQWYWASLMAQTVKNLPAMQETWVQSLGQEDPLEKGMATHSSILSWRIPWTEGPGGLQSMQSQRVRHDSVTSTSLQWYYVIRSVLWSYCASITTHSSFHLWNWSSISVLFSLIFIFKTFIKYGKFVHYFFKYSMCFTVSFPSGTPNVCMLVCLMVSYRSLMLCSLFFSPFLYVPHKEKIFVVLFLLFYFESMDSFSHLLKSAFESL